MGDLKAGPVRLRVLAGTPVYYDAPLYRRLAADPRLDFTAIFASSEGAGAFDPGFGRPVDFGIDPLGGYQSVFLRRAHSVSVAARGGTESSPFALRDPDVVRVLLRERPEVLWIQGYNFVTHALAAATQRLRRRPLLWREVQTTLDSRPMWKRTLKAVGLRVLFGGCRGLYIGTENRRWLESFGVPPERLFFTPFVVDNESLRRQADELVPHRAALRQKLGIAPDATVVLTVGRLIAKKQPQLLLDAFARVRRVRPCTLLFVGTGQLESALRERVRRESIPDVVFAGFRPQTEIAAMYAVADIFALVSCFQETWGAVVNEAMNFGLPVVVTDKVGSATDLVQDGRNGYVVGSRDVEGLARRLEALVGSAELRVQLGRQSAEIVRGWTYERAAEGVVAAVAAAVGADRWARAAA